MALSASPEGSGTNTFGAIREDGEMYPLAEGMFAPRNQWYVAAFAKEVTRKPMERWILDRPIALYRTEDGSPVALDGRCPHRHFPLGKGITVGDNLECGYHGMQFRPDGSVASVPSQRSVPRACSVQSYPVVEMGPWIWFWAGDPHEANPALLPDPEKIGLADAGFELSGTIHIEVPARYMLLHDNLFDLTHLQVLHRSTIAGGEFVETKEERRQTDRTLASFRRFKKVKLPPLFAEAIGFDEECDREVVIEFNLPALHYFYDRFIKPGKGLDGGSNVGEIRGHHGLTPATRHSTHYFATIYRNFGLGSDELGAGLMHGIGTTMQEDCLASSEIEAMLGKLPSVPSEILLQSDTTCGLGRRMIASAIEREAISAPALAV